jgi:hypothetical protein
MATKEERVCDGVPVPEDLMEPSRAVANSVNVRLVL